MSALTGPVIIGTHDRGPCKTLQSRQIAPNEGLDEGYMQGAQHSGFHTPQTQTRILSLHCSLRDAKVNGPNTRNPRDLSSLPRSRTRRNSKWHATPVGSSSRPSRHTSSFLWIHTSVAQQTQRERHPCESREKRGPILDGWLHRLIKMLPVCLSVSL
ncbi:hypothetical protein CMEL01_06802 [Colletotrichum melonis]|uniref:Uncharacterized protein n=1 Tax=Colletotrichum melonis TaxID=1209925 RepID=A0AAI9XKF1_9PEZI|nr:hypothetical protein CMEL01_06802 [Colletotrichum melonis]